MVRSPGLRDALATYTQDALETLEGCVAAGATVPEAEEEVWVPQGAGFARATRPAAPWAALAASFREDLRKLPAHRAALDALAGDAAAARHLGQLVSAGAGVRRIQGPAVLEELVARAAETQGAPAWDEAAFGALYAQLEDAFHQPLVGFEMLAPLRAFRSDAAPIALEEDLEVARLDDADVARLLRAVPFAPVEGVVHDPPRFAVRLRYRVPKLVGDPGPAPAAGHMDAQERVRDVLRALTAFRPGRVGRAALVRSSTHWFLRGIATVGPPGLAHGWGRPCVLARADAAQLPSFWATLQRPEVRGRAALGIALRRFREACARERPEDRLIDLLVTAEALALQVPHDSSDPDEMRYRLALRTGSSLAPGLARRDVDRHLRSAYKLRDAIVRGAAPEVPPAAEGQARSLDEFLDATEALLRDALQRAVALTADPGASADIDWAALAAGRRPSPPPALPGRAGH